MWPRIKQKWEGWWSRWHWRGKDQVLLELPCLRISLQRKLDPRVPHEVTVVVPRAEIRGNCRQRGQGCHRCRKDCAFEVVLSSVTVVSAPRHEPGGKPGEKV